MAAFVVTRSTVTPWSRSSSATARAPDGAATARVEPRLPPSPPPASASTSPPSSTISSTASGPLAARHRSPAVGSVDVTGSATAALTAGCPRPDVRPGPARRRRAGGRRTPDRRRGRRTRCRRRAGPPAAGPRPPAAARRRASAAASSAVRPGRSSSTARSSRERTTARSRSRTASAHSPAAACASAAVRCSAAVRARPVNSACSVASRRPERADLEAHRDHRDDHQQQDHDDPGVAARRGPGDIVEQVAEAVQQPPHHPQHQAGTGVLVDLLGQLVAGQLGSLVRLSSTGTAASTAAAAAGTTAGITGAVSATPPVRPRPPGPARCPAPPAASAGRRTPGRSRRR